MTSRWFKLIVLVRSEGMAVRAQPLSGYNQCRLNGAEGDAGSAAVLTALYIPRAFRATLLFDRARIKKHKQIFIL